MDLQDHGRVVASPRRGMLCLLFGRRNGREPRAGIGHPEGTKLSEQVDPQGGAPKKPAVQVGVGDLMQRGVQQRRQAGSPEGLGHKTFGKPTLEEKPLVGQEKQTRPGFHPARLLTYHRLAGV